MKKIVIIAALIAASIGANAQHVTDTLVSLKDLKNVSSEIMELNTSLKRHARMATTGIAVTTIGAVGYVFAKRDEAQQQVEHNSDKSFLCGVVSLGGAMLFAASYIPILNHKIQVDGRGIVIPIGKKDKRK